MLLLALLTFAPATCYLRPWCASQSLIRELRPLQLLVLHGHTLWLASWCRKRQCAIFNQLLKLQLMLLLAFIPPPQQPATRGPDAPAKACSESWGHCSYLPIPGHTLWLAACAGGTSAPSLISCWSLSWGFYWPLYLRPSNLLQEAQMRLPKLISRARAIAATCPSLDTPFGWRLVQGAPVHHPQSVAGAWAEAATGPHSSALPAWRKRPWCTCQSLFRELGPLLLLVLFVHTLWLASCGRGPQCGI